MSEQCWGSTGGCTESVSDEPLAEDPVWMHAQDVAQGEREDSRRARDAAAIGRFRTAENPSRNAARREESARSRDLIATARDLAAEARDKALVTIERSIKGTGRGLQQLLDQAVEVRAHAAADRRRSAEDREQAARDRADAARERTRLMDELRLAHVDELTDAYLRPSGVVVLRQEIERVRRRRGQLVLAYVQVDDLDGVNERDGRGAGDVLLRTLAMAIRSKTRSYEPIVRYGEDEFLCSFADVDPASVRERFEEISRAMGDYGENGTFSVGFAALSDSDTLDELVVRARRRDGLRPAGSNPG